jgi:hypothetical protein
LTLRPICLNLQGSDFGALLPQRTLKNVKELTIRCSIATGEEPVWPTTWGQLTAMTSFNINCRNSRAESYLPRYLTDLRNLKNLVAITSGRHFAESGCNLMEQRADTHKQLTRLQVDFVEPLGS